MASLVARKKLWRIVQGATAGAIAADSVCYFSELRSRPSPAPGARLSVRQDGLLSLLLPWRLLVRAAQPVLGQSTLFNSLVALVMSFLQALALPLPAPRTAACLPAGGERSFAQKMEEIASYKVDAVPATVRERFLRYAHFSEEDGEYVLGLEDFVACMLLLHPSSVRASNSAAGDAHGTRGAGAPSASAEQPQMQPQQQMPRPSVALDWFPPQVRKRLSDLFDLVDMDGNKRLNYAEFVVLFTFLSTSPRTFQLAFRMFDERGANKLEFKDFVCMINTLIVDPKVQIVSDAAAAEAKRKRLGSDNAKRHSSNNSNSDSSSIGGSLMALGDRLAGRDSRFAFHIPESLVRKLVLSPLPEHTNPPPGSKHHSRSAKAKEARRQLEALRACAAADATKEVVSYDTFWYRMDFIRWEIRAIEFGMYDEANTGRISVADLRRILSYSARQRPLSPGEREKHPGLEITTESTAPFVGPGLADAELCAQSVTWQFYQTVFDIIRESDLLLPALTLALRSEPPVSEGGLHHGALEDDAVRTHRERVLQLVRQKQAADTPAESEKVKQEQKALALRPTALTWKQFSAALEATQLVPTMSTADKQLFFVVFDTDLSGTMSVQEFCEICNLKQSFFVPYLPRFEEPRRNTVQQFFFCMQQLE